MPVTDDYTWSHFGTHRLRCVVEHKSRALPGMVALVDEHKTNISPWQFRDVLDPNKRRIGWLNKTYLNAEAVGICCTSAGAVRRSTYCFESLHNQEPLYYGVATCG
jgi:hypothetical protein